MIKKIHKNSKLFLKLNFQELKKVKEMRSKGVLSVRVLRRARVLELFHKGLISPKVAEYVGVSPETARRIGWNYLEGGLEFALFDKPRPGKERALNETQANKIIAFVCSDPPDGRERWTIELIAEEAISRKIVQTVGRETIRVLLHSHDLKPWREKNVVRS